jgi:hypothetical protein
LKQESPGFIRGEDVKFDDVSPSGCSRPRVLIESDPIFETSQAAKDKAEEIIREVKELPKESWE